MSGRWVSRDPTGLDGGENLYEYCAGNPLMNVDPSGLDWVLSIFGFEFHSDGLGDALETGDVALMDTLSHGHWQNEEYMGQVGYHESTVIAIPARESLEWLLTAGAGKYIKGAAGIGMAAREGETAMQYGLRSEQTMRKFLRGSKASKYIAGLGRRYIDCMIGKNAIEMKTGLVRLAGLIPKQIAKDAALIARGSVKSVTWVGSRNSLSGNLESRSTFG